MELFPSVMALAAAPLEKVIKAWEGLGYYSRARRLHAAAKELVNSYGGQVPAEESLLQEISGLGPYTTSAILSFAYHQKKAAVDGNVLRVMSRYRGIKEDVGRSHVIRGIREEVEKILPEQEPWVVMEAFIELGALVCKKKPLCSKCPLRMSCKAYQEGAPEEYPRKKAKAALIKLQRRVFVIYTESHILLRQEKQKGSLMEDLWEFPYIENSSQEKEQMPSWLIEPFAGELVSERELVDVVHHFTKYQVKLLPSLWKAKKKPPIRGCEWLSLESLQEKAFSSGHRKLVQQILTSLSL